MSPSTEEATRPSTENLSQSSSKTQIEPRVAAFEAALEAKSEADSETIGTPSIEEVTALINNALPSVPEARLVITSPDYPKSNASEGSIIRLPQTINNRVMYAVVQTTEDVDFIINLPFHTRRSENLSGHLMPLHLTCQILYHPGSDDCLLVNQGRMVICLTSLSSPLTQEYISGGDGRVIRPGMWRLSVINSKESNLDANHLVELLVRRRCFTVTIHRPADSLPAKRAADNDTEDDGKSTKRQRMKAGVAEIATSQVTNAPTTELEPAPAANAIHQHLTPISRREIINKLAVPLLDLTDRETAVIRSLQASNDSPPQDQSTMNTGATYNLQRVKNVVTTRSTSVFTCQHSAILEKVVVKVLHYDGKSTYNLTNFARLWQREKKILEKLNHGNIISLKAFDGRMFAMYLEFLPSSLVRGSKSLLQPSDAYVILRDISSALAYLATQQVVHNDIKPGNIAYSVERGAVLLDFGMATSITGLAPGGTPWYLPPEVINYTNDGKPESKAEQNTEYQNQDKPDGQSRGLPGDVWALGITMLYVLGKIEFPGRNSKAWAIKKLSDSRSDAVKQMKKWLDSVARKRDKLDHTDKVEHLVFKMLDNTGTSRIIAADIESSFETLSLDCLDDKTEIIEVRS